MADGNEDWIYNLLLHEIGHALLIDHSDVPGTVMLPDGFGPGRPDLMPDDTAAVQAVWGPPASVPPDLAETGRLFAPTHAVAWRGTVGDDTFSPMVYGALDDLFAGGFGADHIEGGNGYDTLKGGPGDDLMRRGGQDEDLLHGEEGNDSIRGDLEGDTLDGGPGTDHIVPGDDTGAGDGHIDHVHFASGEVEGDVVYGLEDHDMLWVDGMIATKGQVAALGVTFVPIAQA